MNLTVSDEEVDPHTSVLVVQGDIDLASAPHLARVIEDRFGSEGTCLIVDLDGVTFIDSSGLAVLITAQRNLQRADGALFLVCSSSRLRRGFEITGVVDLLGMVDTRAHALSAAREFAQTA
jgi:anti-sigma B factor antagonist